MNINKLQNNKNNDGIDVEQSVIDEDELQRQLEEELANMNYQPDADDLMERQSNYSIFNQSQSNFNTIGGPNGLEASANNMDDYVEKMIQKERDRNKILKQDDFRKTNSVWKEFLDIQHKEVQEVIPENWNEELEDLKQLNLQELDGLVSHNNQQQFNNTQGNQFFETKGIKQLQTPKHKSTKFSSLQENGRQLDSDELNRIEEEFQIEKNSKKKKHEIPKLIMAEDKILESYNQQLQLENSILKSQQFMTVSESINFDQYKQSHEEMQFLNRHEDMIDRINVVNQGIKRMQEYELEMERLFMEREDKLSREIEEYAHRTKFIQKDMHPPLLPPYFSQPDNPLKSKPVQRTPQPTAPMVDNFMKYRINFGGPLPGQIDLSKVKILWSREKQQEQEEQQRVEFEKQRREQEHQRLNGLLKFSQKQIKDTHSSDQQQKVNSKTQQENLQKFLVQNKKNVLQQQSMTNESYKIQIELKPVIIGKDPNLYNSPDEIYQKYLLKQHETLSSNLIKIIPSLKQTQPTLKETEDAKPKAIKRARIKNKNLNSLNDNDFMNIPDIAQSDSLIGQALELHAPNPNKSEKIEIKNEQIITLDLKPLCQYKILQILNLSMNKIGIIENGTLDLPYLSQVRLTDNVLKEIPNGMFSKCPNVKLLHLDINQLKKIQNLNSLINLEDLSISNNQIQNLDGVQSLTKLRRLNVSFNKITSIDSFVNNLTFLEYLELGKNFISNIDNFPSHKLLYLSELYLYSNSLSQIPKNFALPQLKVLNLNRNQDLHQLQLGYNPLLEQLNASYCSLVQIKPLLSCPSLKEMDISFNSINNLETFLHIIEYNKLLRTIRFSDNPFSLNKDQHFDQYLKRLFIYLERVNGEPIQNINKVNQVLVQNNFNPQMKNLLSILNQSCLLRQFVNKQMTQKIRVNFFSTTHLMKYGKMMLPFQMLQQLTTQISNLQYQPQQSSLTDILSQNHDYVSQLRNSVRIITSFFRKRKILRRALIAKMKKHLPKIVKIQSLLKGHLARVKNSAIVERIKRDGPKKTKKYQQISMLQANIKGYLFRNRRIRALKRLNQNKNNVFEDDFDTEFDADKFFGIKEDLFQKGLSLPQEQMMQQMISMMMQQPKTNQIANNQTMSQLATQNAKDSGGSKFPPINQKNQTQSNINELIKPRSMIQNQQKIKSNRPPSARSNAISEIDMNSDIQSIHNQGGNSQVRRNNLMSTTNNDYNGNPHHLPSISGNMSRYYGDDNQSERQTQYSMNSNPFYPKAGAKNSSDQSGYFQKIHEEKKKHEMDVQSKIEEWGFMKEESKKILEQRYRKKDQMKKKKELSAAEKYALIKAQNAKR